MFAKLLWCGLFFLLLSVRLLFQLPITIKENRLCFYRIFKRIESWIILKDHLTPWNSVLQWIHLWALDYIYKKTQHSCFIVFYIKSSAFLILRVLLVLIGTSTVIRNYFLLLFFVGSAMLLDSSWRNSTKRTKRIKRG